MKAAGSVLALDVGHKRIGVALASMAARMPSPLVTLSNDEETLDKISQLITEHQVLTLVVGLPRGLEGQETLQTKTVRDFASKLDKHIEIPVVFQDEAVTSVLAKEALRLRKKPYSKEDIDMYAACQILQDYLNLQATKEVA